MRALAGGGPLGSGKQFVSWIHRDDLVALFIAALKEPEKYAGVVNGKVRCVSLFFPSHPLHCAIS
jgi:NAD dependent epimerase/dehydratase family enzyme